MIFDLDGLLADTVSGGVRAFDSTVPLLRRLREVGAAAAAYSCGRNCAEVLQAAGIDEFLSVTVTKTDAGVKLDPAVLIETARRLGVRPDRCVVIEPDELGVAAGSAGGFSLVIGLDRDGGAAKLLSCGADAVIADLAELSVRTGDAAMSALPDALQVYSQLKELVTARRPMVFLDFDGTLSDIVENPASATLLDGGAEALRALAAQCAVGVISGRDLADVRDRVNVDGLWLAGSHGFELVAPDGSHHQNPAPTTAVATLAHAATRLAEDLSDIPGTLVEHKRFAVAMHYRNVDPEHVDHVIAAVRRLGRSEGLRVTTGRKVIELRPNVDWDKGKTLHWMLDHIAAADSIANPETVLPIYIGDDITDEDAFDVVRFDGLGIMVRHDEALDRRSSASFSLESPSAVLEFIRHLADDLADVAASPDDRGNSSTKATTGERLREALCTVGNGYVATRGCAPEAAASEVHYPGTYATGVYNILSDRMAGRTIENESLVNLPNWLSLTFRIDDGPWFSVDDTELLFYRQIFGLRHATLTRKLRFRDGAGRITTLIQQRLASMHEPHLVAMQTTISAENCSGTVEFRSLIDGTVRNTMVERYRSLSSTHLTESVIDEMPPDAVLLRTQTSQSEISIALAARSTVWLDDAPADAQYVAVREANRGGHDIQVALSEGRSISHEKIATIFTGRDTAISEPASTAQQYLNAAGIAANACTCGSLDAVPL